MRLLLEAEVCSTMKSVSHRTASTNAKQKKYHVATVGQNTTKVNAPPRRFEVWFTRRQSRRWMAVKTGKPGGQRVYDQTVSLLKRAWLSGLYKLAYRTEGFLHELAARGVRE